VLKIGVRESFPGLYINKSGGLERLWQEQGQGMHLATRRGKAGESDGGRKTPQERREDPLPT
jgi:hypothetical protein